MSTREKIQAKIAEVADDRLDDLYYFIEDFCQADPASTKVGILRKLQSIKIDGPVDFSENWNLYVTGEKSIDENLP